MIKNVPQIVFLALALAVASCGSGGGKPGMDTGPMGTGGSASETDTMPAIDGAGTGGAGGATGAGTGGMVAAGTGGAASGTGGGSGGAAASGSGGTVAGAGGAMAGAGGAGGETPPPLPYCPGWMTQMACGYVGAPVAGGYEHVPRWKDGREISTCADTAGKPLSGCLVPRSVDPLNGAPRAPNLCVTNCAQGCYRKAGSVCSSDADCCSPLRCKPGTVGTNKTCQ